MDNLIYLVGRNEPFNSRFFEESVTVRNDTLFDLSLLEMRFDAGLLFGRIGSLLCVVSALHYFRELGNKVILRTPTVICDLLNFLNVYITNKIDTKLTEWTASICRRSVVTSDTICFRGPFRLQRRRTINLSNGR